MDSSDEYDNSSIFFPIVVTKKRKKRKISGRRKQRKDPKKILEKIFDGLFTEGDIAVITAMFYVTPSSVLQEIVDLCALNPAKDI